MQKSDPTALTAAILAALCLLLSTCSNLPAPGPALDQTTAAIR